MNFTCHQRFNQALMKMGEYISQVVAFYETECITAFCSIEYIIIKVFSVHSYIIVRGMLVPEEVSRLKKFVENDSDIANYAYEVDDGKGRKSRLCIWNHPGDDISGRIIRFNNFRR